MTVSSNLQLLQNTTGWFNGIRRKFWIFYFYRCRCLFNNCGCVFITMQSILDPFQSFVHFWVWAIAKWLYSLVNWLILSMKVILLTQSRLVLFDGIVPLLFECHFGHQMSFIIHRLQRYNILPNLLISLPRRISLSQSLIICRPQIRCNLPWRTLPQRTWIFHILQK